MFDLLELEFSLNIIDANELNSYVSLGTITQQQANQITSSQANATN